MRSLQKSITAFFHFVSKNIISRISVITIVIIVFASLAASAQLRRINMNRFILRPDTTVKVQSIKNGRVAATENTSLSNVQVEPNKKTVVSFDQKQLSPIDSTAYRKFHSITQLPYSQEIKIIPELHIESKEVAGQDIIFKIIFAELQPFLYNDTTKKFKAWMGFYLIPESGSGNAEIKEPVYIEVVSSDVTVIDPHQLRIDHLNLPPSNVNLVAENVSDSVRIKVITTTNPDGYITYLKVKPAVKIFTNAKRLQAFGIQKIPVEVQLIGSNSPDSVLVNFNPSKGTVKPKSVYVSYNRPATVYLTSGEFGKAKLSAISTLTSNDLDFTYAFPWYFLLASIIGGLIGGFAKYFYNPEKKKFNIHPIIGGILIGLMVAIAYYFLGINLLKLNVSAEFSEIAVLGLSALGAYFGIGGSKDTQ